MDQNSIIRSLAFMLGVVLLIIVSWGAFKAVTEAKADYSNMENVETLDTDVALASTIDSLEAHWNHRLNYHFNVTQDPLFPGRVIKNFTYAKQGFREVEEATSLRLSATVTMIGDFPMAILKYQGKSYVVKVGDRFGGGHLVKDIQEKKVVLNRKGKDIVLHNKPLDNYEKDYQQNSEYSGEY